MTKFIIELFGGKTASHGTLSHSYIWFRARSSSPRPRKPRKLNVILETYTSDNLVPSNSTIGKLREVMTKRDIHSPMAFVTEGEYWPKEPEESFARVLRALLRFRYTAMKKAMTNIDTRKVLVTMKMGKMVILSNMRKTAITVNISTMRQTSDCPASLATSALNAKTTNSVFRAEESTFQKIYCLG
jgi:hypothetical protein